jgi:hypothetical protein
MQVWLYTGFKCLLSLLSAICRLNLIWYRTCLSDCIWSLSGSKSLQAFFLIVCLRLYYCLRSNCQEGEGWDPIKWFNTTKFLYLSQARIWISNIMSSKISLVKEQLVQVSTNLKLIQNIDLFKKKYTDYLKSKQNNEWLWHYIHYTQIVIFCCEDVCIVWNCICCI